MQNGCTVFGVTLPQDLAKSLVARADKEHKSIDVLMCELILRGLTAEERWQTNKK